MGMLHELVAGDYRLTVDPARGGSILALRWRAEPLLREAGGSSILDAACFPLVPYSNRIAGGRFRWRDAEHVLPPNYPEVDPVNPLHGFGWLVAWQVVALTGQHILMEHRHTPDPGWPFACHTRLEYWLAPDGLTARLSLANLDDRSMPGGLGFHPYFPCNAKTSYLGLHRGEWLSDRSGLPVELRLQDREIDWWRGRPVAARSVDTVYTQRQGALTIGWPDRDLSVEMRCSDNLSCTSVFVPPQAEWFCVEPVTHSTNAVNGIDGAQAMTALMPGDEISATMSLHARKGLPAAGG